MIPYEELRRKLSFKIDYNLEEWQEYKRASCYLYAINLFVNDYFLPGEIIGKKCTKQTPKEILIETIKEELEYLGFEVEETKLEYITANEEHKICLVRNEKTGFYHFYREDSDGKWSNKYPIGLPKRTDSPEKDKLFSQNNKEIWYFKLRLNNC